MKSINSDKKIFISAEKLHKTNEMASYEKNNNSSQKPHIVGHCRILT